MLIPTLLLSVLIAAVPTEPVAPTPSTTTTMTTVLPVLPAVAPAVASMAAEPAEGASKAVTVLAAGAGAAAGTGIGLVLGVSTTWVLTVVLGFRGYWPYVSGAVVLLGGAVGGGVAGVAAVDRPDAILGAVVGATAGAIGGALVGAFFGYLFRPDGSASGAETLIAAAGGCVGGAGVAAMLGVAIGAEADPPPPWHAFPPANSTAEPERCAQPRARRTSTQGEQVLTLPRRGLPLGDEGLTPEMIDARITRHAPARSSGPHSFTSSSLSLSSLGVVFGLGAISQT